MVPGISKEYTPDLPEVRELRRGLDSSAVFCTGLVLQELLQGFSKPKASKQIISHFVALPLLVPDRDDHIDAAELSNTCRREGIRIGTIDALLAQLCIRHELTMRPTDQDFQSITDSLSIWHPKT